MLRFAQTSKTYDVTIEVAGQPVALKLRSLALWERLEILDCIFGPKTENTTIDPTIVEARERWNIRFETMARVIAEIDGQVEVVDTLKQLEHIKDINEIALGVVRWLFLEEQDSKNFSSSSEQPTPETAGDVEKTAGAVSEHV